MDSLTLFRFPKPRRWIAWDFQSGSGGLNATAEGGADAFNTPRGNVTSTASALYTVGLACGLRGGAAQTSTPFTPYRTARAAVFNRMSNPSDNDTGTQEYPLRTVTKEKKKQNLPNEKRKKKITR